MKFPTIEPLESRIAPAVLSIITPVDNPKNEGSGAGSLTDYVFKIQLDVADASDVTVRAITRDGTATDDDSDFEFKDELITIPAGQTEATFTVKVKQDTDNEADETFAVELTSPSNNATLGPNINVGATILNDDAFLSINDVTISEGDNGTSTAIFTVSRTPASNLQVTVKVSTMDVSTSSGNAAGAAADFVAKTETLTFLPNESFKTFAVTINGDRSFESPEEIFKVLLSEATGAVIVDGEGIGKIQDANDPAPTISIGDAQVREGDSGTKNLEFTVTLSTLAGADVIFDVASAVATGADAATSDVDFTAINLTGQIIPEGQKTLTISVPIVGDGTDELDERFFVNLTNARTTLPGQTNATTLTITDAQGVGTILNDDLMVSIGADPVFTEGNTGAGQFHIPVNLSQSSSHDVLVTFTIAGGTATAGVDFTVPTNLTVTIPAGQTSADIVLDVLGDTLDENDEKLNVTLTGATNAQFATGAEEVTITDDDAAPTLTISSPNVTEGQDAVFTVTLSSPSAKPVEVRWVTETGSATSGDFTETTSEQTLTIPAGQTTGQIRVSTTNDSTDELDEAFKVNVLATTTNANVGTGISGTATIGTNDLSTFSIGDVSEVEGDAGTKTFTFTVTRSGSSKTLTSTVNFTTVNGTALVSAGDYDLATGALTFGPTVTSQQIQVTVHGDATNETDETFFVNLSTPVGATISDGSATGTIRNDEASYKLVRVDNGPLTVDEEAAGGAQQFVEFKVVREGQFDVPGVVFFATAADDTVGARQATSGTDFTSVSGSVTFATGSQEAATTIRVPLTQDNLAEGSETFKVKLSNGTNGIISTTNGEAIVTIADNDAANLPRVTIGDAKLVEGNSGSTDLVFKIKLVGVDGTTPAAAGGDITVTFNVAEDTASIGSDFSAPTTLTVVFTAGQTEKDITVPVFGDSVDENDETFFVNLTGAEFAVPGGPSLPVTSLDNQAIGTITNDDLLLSVEASGSEPEGLVDHARIFTLSIPQISTHDVTVHYKTTDGTAVSTGSFADYIATEGDVTILAGQTSATFSVQLKGDRYAENSETFKVQYSDVHGAKLSATESNFTLANDDAAPSLTIGDATVVEGDSGRANLVFNVTLAGGTQEEVKVDFSTLDGTAKSTGALVDYENTSGTLTFAPSAEGATMQVSVPIIGDTWKEANESFSVKLANARIGANTSGVTLADDTGAGTIQDNGDTQLGIIVNNARVVEGNSGSSTLSFNIETTAPVSGSSVTFKASTRNGTARAGTDFTALSGQSFSIASGQSSVSVAVSVTSETQFEQSEYLFLDVSNLSAGVSSVSGGSGTISTRGIILNDDIRIVSGREFEYVDEDGDLVSVKVSKGSLSVPISGNGGTGNDVFFTQSGTVGGRFFQRLDLSNDGFEFNGANITVTAKPQVLVTGEVLGDGKANVGAIDAALPQPGLFQFATGQLLGTVKIAGDLGRIIAGSTKTPAGVRVLDVGSLGAGANIPSSPVNGLNPNSSLVLGPIGKMTVRGDVVGSLSVIGDSIDQPIPSGSVGRIGTLVVKGVIRGGSAESSGQIAFTGGIGSATLGGIVGGSGSISGALLPVDGRFNTSISKLTVLGDIVGGSGANSGFVNTGKLGSLVLGKLKQRSTDVAIEGNLIGGSGNQSGAVFSNNNIGRVLVNGDIQGGSGASSARISAVHNLGSTRVTGDVIGGNKNTDVTAQDASNSGVIAGALLKGTLVIEGDVKGGSGAGSGAVDISGDTVNFVSLLANVPSVTVGKSGVAGKGNIIGGSGADSGHISIAGTVKKFVAYGDIRGGKGNGSGGLFVLSDAGNAVLKQAVIKGNLIGGSTDAPGTTGGVASLLRSGIIDAGNIGKLTVEGRIQGGVNAGTSLAGSGGIFSDGTIGTLKVLGNGGTEAVKGDKSASVVISAVEGIRSATFSGNVSFAEILAGYSAPSAVGTPRGSLVDAGANIGTINVTGTFSASSIVAGVDAGGDGKFGTIDDQQTTTGQPANQNLISRIASVILGNVAANANASATAAFGIVAEQVDSIKVNGAAITVQKGPHNDEIEIGGTATKIKLLEV